MRLISNVKRDPSVKRLMIYASVVGVYLFYFDKMEDSASVRDDWYAELDDALLIGQTDFGVELHDWQENPDPVENCLHDRIEQIPIASGSQD